MELQLFYPLAFSLTAIALLIAGMRLLFRISKWEESNPLRPYLLQILGLTFILPVVLVAAVAGKLNDQALSALLGGMVAFVFGGRSISYASDKNDSSQNGHDHRLGHSNLQESQLAKVDSDAKEGAGRNDDQGPQKEVTQRTNSSPEHTPQAEPEPELNTKK